MSAKCLADTNCCKQEEGGWLQKILCEGFQGIFYSSKTKEKAEALLLKVKQDKKKETDQLSLFEIGGLI